MPARPPTQLTRPWGHSLRAGFKAIVAERSTQAAFKFWVVTATVMVLMLALSEADSVVRAAQPIFGYVAACVAFQDRVEATADKVRGAAERLGAERLGVHFTAP